MQLKITIAATLISASGVGGVYSSALDLAYAGFGRMLRAANPCTQTITYRIGELDDGFPVSRGQFVSAVSDAAALWDKAVGRVVFAEDPVHGVVAITLSEHDRASDVLSYSAAAAPLSTYDDAISSERVVIHAFPGRKGLTRVIAREFGHVLGLTSTTTEGALMNPSTPSDEPQLSEADRLALSALCAPASHATAE